MSAPKSHIRSLLAACFLPLGGCRHPVAPYSLPTNINIVAFGDSITRGYGVPVGNGWVEILSYRLQARSGVPGFFVFNSGGNGNTSTEGLRRIETDVLPHLPGLVLVEFGGNDAVEGDRHVSLDEYDRNLRTIHREVTGRGGKMVLVTFPPIINEWHVAGTKPYFLQRGGLDEEVERYRRRTRQAARELDLPLFDLDRLLRKLTRDQDAETYILGDGVHLTTEGNLIVAREMEKFLTEQGLIAGNYRSRQPHPKTP